MNLKRYYDIGFYNNTEVIHIPCKEQDIGCQFVFSIIDDNGEPIDVSDYNLSFYEIKPDGCFIEGDTDVLSVDGNKVTLTTNEQMTAAPGTNVCEIRVKDSLQTPTVDVTTWKFYLEVSESVHGSGTQSESVIHSIDVLIDEAARYAEQAEQSAELAEEYAGGFFSEYTITASGWNTNTKIYSFESTYPHSEVNIEVSISSEATEEQYVAWSNAIPVGMYNSNSIKAFGDVPTVNIPVIIRRTPVVQQEGG